MYLKQIQIKNIGPIKEMNYYCPFHPNGNPKPIIFVGENGCGKTILMSHIINSIFEYKRQHYNNIEINNDQLFKLQSKTYISSNQDFGYSYLTFNHNEVDIFYLEFLSKISYSNILTKYGILDVPNFNPDDERFMNHGLYMNFSQGDATKKALDESIVLFFPADRSESPFWLNENSGIKNNIKSIISFIGQSKRKTIVAETLKELESWILDIYLDSFIYGIPRNIKLKELINTIFSIILTTKFPDKHNIRIGINSRSIGTARIAICNGNGDTTEVIVPSLYHLSSGELSIIVLFLSIIKDYDSFMKSDDLSANDLEGLVLIDEIDLHLHTTLQYAILPSLIRIFPRIQFIVTSHSPLFLAGMQQIYKDDFDIIELPTVQSIHYTNFSEYMNALQIIDKETFAIKRELDNLKETISINNNPLIYTEGKTDWKHIKKAFQKLNLGTDLNFYEFEEDIGETNLLRICENISRIPNNKPLIFIFDSDNPTILKTVNETEKTYKYWGNNVFSFSIPIPDHRKKHTLISIEFYYSDDEIMTKDSSNRRLFLSSEFKKGSGRNNTDPTIIYKYSSKLPSNDELIKIIDSDVFDIEEKNIALSKSDFVNYISQDIPPFNKFNFKHFKKIHWVIESILSSIN